MHSLQGAERRGATLLRIRLRRLRLRLRGICAVAFLLPRQALQGRTKLQWACLTRQTPLRLWWSCHDFAPLS